LGLDQRSPDDGRVGKLGHWYPAIPDSGRFVLRNFYPVLMNLVFGLYSLDNRRITGHDS
jgi:hypothetical protein